MNAQHRRRFYTELGDWTWWVWAITTALLVFGYCLLARSLSLLPWNSHERYTLSRLRRTFFSAPDLDRVMMNSAYAGCAGGLCTIEAQVAPPTSPPDDDE